MLTMLIENDDEQGLMRSLSKAEIELVVRDFIDLRLETTDSGVLFLLFKQAEFAIKMGLEALKKSAFDALGQHLGGMTSGTLYGHVVSISYPREWSYSPAVEGLKEQHKKQLAELQEQEKTEGVARQVLGKGRIVVTLRDR